jgi:uncharacterized protein YjaZ
MKHTNIDFKTIDPRDEQVKGITLSNGKNRRIVVYLHQHNTLDDIYATITHELIHYCIEKYEMAQLDDYQEHEAIFKIMWADEYI